MKAQYDHSTEHHYNVCRIPINLDDKVHRTYATEAGLYKALEKYGLSSNRFLLVYTKTGRATAVFPVNDLLNIPHAASLGFIVIS
tara:strand:+ start:617 stop:871 length:255 start_codon:yes stop_codon:yes gene_type:complete